MIMWFSLFSIGLYRYCNGNPHWIIYKFFCPLNEWHRHWHWSRIFGDRWYTLSQSITSYSIFFHYFFFHSFTIFVNSKLPMIIICTYNVNRPTKSLIIYFIYVRLCSIAVRRLSNAKVKRIKMISKNKRIVVCLELVL